MRKFHFILVTEEDGLEAINKAYEFISAEGYEDNKYRLIASISPQNEVSYVMTDEAKNREIIARYGFDTIKGINSYVQEKYINGENVWADSIIATCDKISELDLHETEQLIEALSVYKHGATHRLQGMEFDVFKHRINGYDFGTYGVTHADYQDYSLPEWVVIIEIL